MSRVLSDAVRILSGLNSTHYFVRTVVELMVMVTFIYQVVMLCLIQIYMVFFVILNSTHYFVRTVVSEFAELMVMVTFIYQAVMLYFTQIYLVFVCVNLVRR